MKAPQAVLFLVGLCALTSCGRDASEPEAELDSRCGCVPCVAPDDSICEGVAFDLRELLRDQESADVRTLGCHGGRCISLNTVEGECFVVAGAFQSGPHECSLDDDELASLAPPYDPDF